MSEVFITPDKIIDKFMKNLDTAFKRNYVRKPHAWALYETWKWVDENEKPRKVVEYCRNRARKTKGTNRRRIRLP